MNNENIKVEDYLKQNGYYLATTVGVSMRPLLKDRKYAVKILPISGSLKKYDVVLFRRGKQLVLHRVIKVYNDNYFIRGDNCDAGEFVFDNQIVGIMSEIIGKDKVIKVSDIKYKLYSRCIVFFFPFLFAFKKIHKFFRRVLKHLFGRRKNERK